MANTTKTKPGRRDRKWSMEEVALLKQLEVRFERERYINKTIAAILTTKSAKQISDKRRTEQRTETVAPEAAEDHLAEEVPEPELERESRNPDTTNPRPKRRLRPPGSTPKHREMDEQLTKAEQLLGVRNNPDSRAEATEVMENITDSLLTRVKKTQKKGPTKGQTKRKKEKCNANSGARKRWATRKAILRATQLLYKTNRRQLARQIMGVPTTTSCPLPIEELEQCFRDKLSKPNNKANLNKFATYQGSIDKGELMSPIEEEEVTKTIKGMNEKSAPGPDGMTLVDIQDIHDEDDTRLPRLFSLWIKSATIPDSLKKSRTVLIPKCEDQERLKDIDNWRPITIGPMLLRLFTKIMAKRPSETVGINPRQKGFLAATPGCNENIAILDNIIKGAKKNRKDLAVVFVDLAKAFDSVGHKLIAKALQRMQLPTNFISLITDLYSGNTPRIEGNKNKTGEIRIERGVKQGDPLSPILFNITLDLLICTLEAANAGVVMPLDENRVNCSALAFADDIALLSDSHAGMNKNLKLLQSFCTNTGLAINSNKTKGYHFTCKAKTYIYNQCENWKLGNEKIAYIPPGETEKYLGARINPWASVTEGEWSSKLKAWTSALQAAALRPAQKTEILKRHVIPRLYFHLILSEVSQNTLIKLDQIIKNTTKELLHLPPHVTDGILYSSNRCGGLGMPKLEVQIPFAIVRKREALERSTDRIIRASFQYRGENNSETIGGLRRLKVLKEVEDFLANTPDGNTEGEDAGNLDVSALPMLEDQGQTRNKPINRYAEWREWEFHKWNKLISQGAGIGYYQNDRISSTWIRSFHNMKSHRLINNILLRTNLYPTRTTLSRGRPNSVKTCRRCEAAQECLSHISGGCQFVKLARIKRHNKILDQLRIYVSKYGWTSFVEPRLVAKDGSLWKLDIVSRNRK
ncbi:hypothetical protein scyTo_0010770 [Scyliorhinus torazame]|uniref:Reverse transcriptase domain-containing protein n=1 Tax=Scyliorhinus torazame TaxID=75743 RepID=A0A401PB75_SCYTO|nr:hypothetical protein [Scyliorhinus torazame]